MPHFLSLIVLLLFVVPVVAAPRYAQELIATPFVEDGKPVRLELVVQKPRGPGPYPTVIFNHGSTGKGDKPERFGKVTREPSAVNYFLREGWMVITPQRRGRAGSGGLYDEGFEPDRSRYSCRLDINQYGMDRALADIDAVMAHVRTRADVQQDRIVLSGQSRGGILSVAYAGLRPQGIAGVVNFVGLWVGHECPDFQAINAYLMTRGARSPRPMLWLYAERDHYLTRDEIHAMFDGFRTAGGRGELVYFDKIDLRSGHFLILRPRYWTERVDAYLDALGRGAAGRSAADSGPD